MNNKILEQLEFNKVKELLLPYLKTEQSQEELLELEPMTEAPKIEKSFNEISDMEQIFVEHHSFGIVSLSSISESLKRLELSADLNIQELLAIKKVLQSSSDMIHFYSDLDNVSFQSLDRLFENLEQFPNLQGSFQAINDGGF